MVQPYSIAAAILLLALAAPGSPPGAPPSAPQAAFDPHSTAALPCGAGAPPPGHFAPDLRPGPDGALLTVKQDGDRLCYVSGDLAEAPVIRVRQGHDLTITLRNEITDPARLDGVVAPGRLETPNPAILPAAGFYSVAPGMQHHATGATNLHVHGFPVPPVPPQDEVLRTCIDPAVGPAVCGRREFTYRYHVPADMPAGLYWYHPHVHGQVQAQILMGLSGAIVVEGPDDDARRAAGIAERVLIVRQTQDLDAGKGAAPAGGNTPAPSPPHPTAAAAVPLHPAANAVDTADELLCAANSAIDEITLNGAPVPIGDAPDTALAQLAIPQGHRELWRVLNAATDAFLDLVLVGQDGKRLPIAVVARDGAPEADDSERRLDSAPTTEPQMVPPAGRIEFLVPSPPPGVKAYLVTRAVDTGCAGDRLPERRLAVVTASPGDGTAAAAPALAATTPSFFSGLMSRPSDRRRVIALAEYPRPGFDDQTDFYIFERKPGAVLRPFEMTGPPLFQVRAGTTEEWLVENWTNELHAFHVHQVHFRVLEVNGKTVENPPLLDVVNVPFATATGYHSKEGPVRPGRVRIKLYFPEELAGDIPFHCHLVDHEDNGMMAVLRVIPATPLRKAELDRASGQPGVPICRGGDGSSGR
jgi:FtsP/CotA-like multicopper oxidase with cupredoxin domain